MEQADFERARETMVAEQLLARGIRDERVLDAFRRVPRHLFVPPEYREMAYADQPLPIGHGATISQPFVVARMTELLQAEPGARILEVGTGSGYQAAILGALGLDVYSVEVVPALERRARELLARLGYDTVHVRLGDGRSGWPEASPFAGILLTAAPKTIPSPLVDQLAVGGRLVGPEGRAQQDLILIEKTPKGVRRTTIFPVAFVPLR